MDKDGKCSGYRFKTDPPNGEICYRGKPNKETCPRIGQRITNTDAERIVRLLQGGEAPPRIPVRTKRKKTRKHSRPTERRYPDILHSPSGETYMITSELDSGTQGEVVLGVRRSDNRSLAIKRFMWSLDPSAAREVEYLRVLRGLPGFPQLIDEFHFEGLNYIVMEQLGRSLRTILGESNGLSPSIAGAIGLQLIDRMQTLHDLGISHNDLYPFNMNMGMNGDQFQLFLIDYGRAEPLKDNGQGDAQALVHSVLQIMNPRTIHERSIKKHASLAEVCQGLPPAMEQLFRTVYKNTKKGRPDYDAMRSVMRQLAPQYDGTVRLV